VRWVEDHKSELRNTDPVMPANILNRRADNWRPLLAIADTAGGDWPEIARQAAVASSDEGQSDTESIRTMLLADIKELFDRLDTDRLASSRICEELALMEERPWPEFSRGKPITVRQIARQLGPLGISPGTIRLDDGATPKGYKLGSFKNAFARYLPPFPSATTPQAAESVAYSENLSATSELLVADGKSPKPAVSATCGGVADENPLRGANTLFEGHDRGPTPEEEARMEAEERAAIEQFDGVPSDDVSDLLKIPPELDRRPKADPAS
jgi:hypothetical protein